MHQREEFSLFLMGYELIHHRVTLSLTEFNQIEIKRIELRDTLCYSVVKTHIYPSYEYILITEHTEHRVSQSLIKLKSEQIKLSCYPLTHPNRIFRIFEK